MTDDSDRLDGGQAALKLGLCQPLGNGHPCVACLCCPSPERGFLSTHKEVKAV
jgi:hypothetical protein